MMLTSLSNWEDATKLFPAFLTVVVMPFAVNITGGIAVGFIAYSVLKGVTGRWRDVHWGSHLISLALLLRCLFLAV
jgi:AGZA family xanthine/uracil permease-like MFS transporter